MRRKKPKHWRKFIVNNLLPPKFELIEKFTPLVDKIVLIAIGQNKGPVDIYKRFQSAFREKVNIGSLDVSTYVSAYRDTFGGIDDIKQQCYLYLVEIWSWCRKHWRRYQTRGTVFYDYVRSNLPRYMAIHLAHQINSYNAEMSGQSYLLQEPTYEPEDPIVFHLNLSWVVIKSKDGVFSNLTTKQKYLLYLRYNRGYTIEKIALLIQQHRAKVEQEFSKLNKILGEYYVTTRNNT